MEPAADMGLNWFGQAVTEEAAAVVAELLLFLQLRFEVVELLLSFCWVEYLNSAVEAADSVSWEFLVDDASSVSDDDDDGC